MHELSIVTYVVKQVQEIAEENNLTEIESVTLEFGEVLALCRNILKIAGTGIPRKSRSFKARNSCMRSSRPSPGATTASKAYPTVQYGKTCPHCGSGKTWLQRNEINIKQIEAR
ncbi:MAG: hydrogenase maturation nickel metallochaperone HypA [Oscillospiraceae bacterium]